MKIAKEISSYISSQPASIRPKLKKLRQVIRKAVPLAEEGVSYRMPVFKLNGIVMYFAAFKEHYSIFVRPVYLDKFRNKLAGYRTTKSAVNIPSDKEVPIKLVSDIAKYAAEQNIRNARIKSKKSLT
jgi:uncharacterized protein YdhG (YjbR/CyaY superfamily)